MRVHAEEGDVAGALRIYKALWNLLDRDYGMEPSPATEELVAQIKLGAFERPLQAGPASGPNPAARATVTNHGPGGSPRPSAETRPAASAKIRLVLRPFAMHGIDGDHAHLVQGFQPASGGVAGAFPRMERGRSARRPRSRCPRFGFGAAILHRDHRLSGRRRNQHGDGAERRSDRHLCLERKLSARPRQLVRGAAAHHPPDRDLAERATIGRTADAACRRARRFARHARPLASRAEPACSNSTRKAGSARSPSFAMPSGKIRRSRLATAASCK